MCVCVHYNKWPLLKANTILIKSQLVIEEVKFVAFLSYFYKATPGTMLICRKTLILLRSKTSKIYIILYLRSVKTNWNCLVLSYLISVNLSVSHVKRVYNRLWNWGLYCGSLDCNMSLITVSYTHLDVYKRQREVTRSITNWGQQFGAFNNRNNYH